jgi:hypothetical protein
LLKSSHFLLNESSIRNFALPPTTEVEMIPGGKLIKTTRAMSRTAISDPTREFKDSMIDPSEMFEEASKHVRFILLTEN